MDIKHRKLDNVQLDMNDGFVLELESEEQKADKLATKKAQAEATDLVEQIASEVLASGFIPRTTAFQAKVFSEYAKKVHISTRLLADAIKSQQNMRSLIENDKIPNATDEAKLAELNADLARKKSVIRDLIKIREQYKASNSNKGGGHAAD